MATDFFARQEAARRSTGRLVVLFVLAVLAIMVSIDLLLAATAGYVTADPGAFAPSYWARATDPAIVGFSVIATLLVVGAGSLFKTAQLRAGGQVVAEQLGGRLLNPDTTVPSEQQVVNVVEEMAIASGTPVPRIYLLDHEPGINAFAAGFTPDDAVIGITRGAVERLTRDELQGVVAHEFSHILNGDMRLNIRLIGILHGILIIGMIGYFLLRATAFSRYRVRRSRQQGGGAVVAILALGAGLAVVGFFGTLFGNLIKAAVSRQREFLADASAVQFTRHPPGLAGALKKIGGLTEGSRIESPNAPEASHLFFGRATGGFAGLFSTHPPLDVRIRRIEPAWDGAFAASSSPVAPAPGRAVAGVAAPVAGPAPARGGAGLGRQGSEAATAADQIARAVDHIGQPGETHLRYAERLRDGLPAPLAGAARESYGARAVVYALLLDRDPAVRQRQLAHLAAAADPGVYGEARRLMPYVTDLDVRLRLPLVEIALPALGALAPAERDRFARNVTALVAADEQLKLLEWSLRRILLHEVGVHRAGARPARVRHHALASVRPSCELLFSVLAHAGHRDESRTRHAFEEGRRRLELPNLRLRPLAELRFEALDDALAELAEATPGVKRRVLHGAAATVAADRDVTAAEAELLRAVSVSLGCPMPPLPDL